MALDEPGDETKNRCEESAAERSGPSDSDADVDVVEDDGSEEEEVLLEVETSRAESEAAVL